MPAVLKVIGSTVFSMLIALVSGPMIKKAIMLLIEHLLERYEESAKASPETSDDKIARDLKAFYEDARKVWSN